MPTESIFGSRYGQESELDPTELFLSLSSSIVPSVNSESNAAYERSAVCLARGLAETCHRQAKEEEKEKVEVLTFVKELEDDRDK